MRRCHQLLAYPPLDPYARRIGVAVVPGVLLLIPAIISGPHAIRHRFRHATGPQHPRQLLGHDQRGQTAWIGLRLRSQADSHHIFVRSVLQDTHQICYYIRIIESSDH
jgi:hypothetical protein